MWGTRLLVLTGAAAAVAKESCYEEATWASKGGKLYFQDEVFRLKGINWFGFENDNYVIDGIWGNGSIALYLDFLAEHNFNAIRMPVSLDVALNKSQLVVANACGPADCSQSLPWSVTAWSVLDKLFQQAMERGIVIMLDMHSLQHSSYESETRWYNEVYSEEDFMSGWSGLVDHFKQYPNLFACDLRNEPHDDAMVNASLSSTWGMDLPKSDWNKAAERAIVRIATDHPDWKGLFFVEGVTNFGSTTVYTQGEEWITNWWGGNLLGLYKNPIDAGKFTDRVVYSPHVYGPGTFEHWYFQSNAAFPHAMEWVWDLSLGFVEPLTDRAVVLGEWGAFSTPTAGNKRSPDDNGNGVSDAFEWQEKLADYLWANCISDTFYWCLNANSVDTGGLLDDDWRTPDVRKLATVESVQPNPSSFTVIESGNICFISGADANADLCRSFSYGDDSIAAPGATRSSAHYYKKYGIMSTVRVEMRFDDVIVGTHGGVWQSSPGVIFSIAAWLGIDEDRFTTTLTTATSNKAMKLATAHAEQRRRSRRLKVHTAPLSSDDDSTLTTTSSGNVEEAQPQGSATFVFAIKDYGDDVLRALLAAGTDAGAAMLLSHLADSEYVAAHGLRALEKASAVTMRVLDVTDTTPTPDAIDAASEDDDDGHGGSKHHSQSVWNEDSSAPYTLPAGLAVAGIGCAAFLGLMLNNRRSQGGMRLRAPPSASPVPRRNGHA